jgi:hypothetical protein
MPPRLRRQKSKGGQAMDDTYRTHFNLYGLCKIDTNDWKLRQRSTITTRHTTFGLPCRWNHWLKKAQNKSQSYYTKNTKTTKKVTVRRFLHAIDKSLIGDQTNDTSIPRITLAQDTAVCKKRNWTPKRCKLKFKYLYGIWLMNDRLLSCFYNNFCGNV